jgi:hypothetical protein
MLMKRGDGSSNRFSAALRDGAAFREACTSDRRRARALLAGLVQRVVRALRCSEALPRHHPSSRNLFDWIAADGQIQRYYFEGPIDSKIARLYSTSSTTSVKARQCRASRTSHAGRRHPWRARARSQQLLQFGAV